MVTVCCLCVKRDAKAKRRETVQGNETTGREVWKGLALFSLALMTCNFTGYTVSLISSSSSRSSALRFALCTPIINHLSMLCYLEVSREPPSIPRNAKECRALNLLFVLCCIIISRSLHFGV